MSATFYIKLIFLRELTSVKMIPLMFRLVPFIAYTNFTINVIVLIPCLQCKLRLLTFSLFLLILYLQQEKLVCFEIIFKLVKSLQ